MDNFTFISNLINHLAWPVTFVIFIFIFKNSISNIFSSLKQVKVKDVEMNFGESIKSIQKDIASIDDSTWKITNTNSLKPNMEWLVQKSPLAVVLQAWDTFEAVILNYAEQISEKKFRSSGIAIEWLIMNNKLPSDYINLYYRIMALKTRFSNFENELLPKERALEFSDTVLSICASIEKHASGDI